MVTPQGPCCDRCQALLPEGSGWILFWFSHLRFCSEACATAELEARRAKMERGTPAPPLCISRYKRSRFWGVYDGEQQLVVVTVYKRGAEEVVRRLNTA